MTISVIIPCFNAERWIEQTLRSIMAQDCDDIEVIVIDDGSTDDTANIVCRVMPAARLIRTPNRGCSAARSLGTQEAKGDFIQYLDADDLLMPGKLQQQLDILQKTGADVAYGDWQSLTPDSHGNFVEGAIISRELEDPDTPEIELFSTFWCPPAAYLFRRSIVEKVTWNENLPVIQDARFALDCALQGGRFVYCQSVMAQYRNHVSDSVSTRSPVAFNRDCFTNAQEVEQWWKKRGQLERQRREVLLQCYERVACDSYKKDAPTFNLAVAALNKLSPNYLPTEPVYLRRLSHSIGYPRAEAARYVWNSLWHAKIWLPLRKCKRALRRTK